MRKLWFAIVFLSRCLPAFVVCAATYGQSASTVKLPTAPPAATSKTKVPVHPYPKIKDDYGIERSFSPHTTVDCLTRPWGGLNVQRSPGANMNTNFMLSSFTVAVLPRLELGTSPMLYGSKDHETNFNGKLNFFRSLTQDWSLGYSRIRYGFDTTSFDEMQMPSRMHFTIQSVQLATNLHPTFTRFQLGIAVTQVHSVLEGDKWIEAASAKSLTEFGLDLLYPIHRVLDLTVGVGTQRPMGITAWEAVHFGAGSSLSWYRPKSIFSKPSLGFHYTPETNNWQALVASKLF